MEKQSIPLLVGVQPLVWSGEKSQKPQGPLASVTNRTTERSSIEGAGNIGFPTTTGCLVFNIL